MGKGKELDLGTIESAPKARPKEVDDWIDDLVGALCDPVIVYPGGGWEDDVKGLPLYKDLAMHRLAHHLLCHQGQADINEATDLEAMLYMYPRTMVAPIGEQWTRIYLYLGTRVMGDKFPEDIKQKELSEYDMRQLRELKRWIRQKTLDHRKDRQRQEKAAATEQKEPEVVPLMQNMFEI